MGFHARLTTHAVFVVVIVAVLAVTVKSVDHRCTYTETKVENCTRTVFYRCQESSEEDSSSSEEESDYDDDHSRKRRSIGDFISNFMQRWRRRRRNGNWCEREDVFKCVIYRCYIACCPGWKYDEDSRTCSIRENPKPDIECMNGGQAVSGSDGPRCECPAMYTGTRCEEVMCDLECLNGGMCDLVSGLPKCVCPDDFKGKRCEKPVCEGGCSTRGECVVEDGNAMCRCQEGYKGQNCEIRVPKDKEGDCPPVTSTTVGICVTSCEMDSNCPGKQKCCANGCGRVCRYPANYTCIHNGTAYEIGDIFNPDSCRVCTCLLPDQSKPFGGAQCITAKCPPMTQGCKKVEKLPSSCCDHCADKTTEQDYEEPRFNNCPTSIVTIDVAHDRNEAILPFTLEAVDFKDNKLEVSLSKSVFKAGIGAENFEPVIATSSRDSAGKYANCEFHVRIRDVHPPKFTFCPTDVLMTEEGKATWKIPTAEDNVGLVRPPTSKRFNPGDHFRMGEHPVEYSSEDYEGNIAKCHFLVRVSKPDASHQGRTDVEDDDSHQKQRHLMFIGSGIAAFLFIVLIIIIAVLCRRRCAGRRDAPPQPPAYENGVYNVGVMMPPPPYKEKPLVYAYDTESIPEKKSDEPGEDTKELDITDVDLKVGVDNPTYRL